MNSMMIVEEIYAAFGEGDIPSILATLAPNVAWHVAGRTVDYPMIGCWRGREGALQFFQKLSETEHFSEFAPKRFHTAADSVVVEGHAALILKHNGASVAYDWVHIWTLRDGQVTRFKEFYDTAQAAEAWRAEAFAPA